MKDLIIVGAGGFGRELVDIVEAINEQTPTWNILGYIDDTPEKQGALQNRYSVIGTIRDWMVEEGQNFAIAIANPSGKKQVVERLKARGAQFVSIVHPSVKISQSAVVGEGFVAYPGSAVNADVNIGNFVTLLSTGIGHDAQIGDYSTISSYCGINGGVIIENEVFIGSHAVLAPGIRIGGKAKVGLGSVVVRNVKPGCTVFGNPAKVIDFE